jgi:tetratricopeptide (TPR) repeat protein
MKDTNYEKVKRHISQGKFHKALQILMEELDYNQNDWNINSLIGFCYRATNNYSEAEKYYLAAIKLNPKDYSSFLGLGIIYQLKKEFSKAISTLKEAINLDPTKIEAINSLGYTYNKMGDINNALVEYNCALETLNNSAFNYLKSNNPEFIGESKDGEIFDVNPKYFGEMNKLLKSNILCATLLSNIGNCFLELGELEKAKEYFMESTAFTPADVNYDQPLIGLQHIKNLENQ